jgi:hypothetical protein
MMANPHVVGYFKYCIGDDQIQRLVEAFAGRKVVWALIGDHGEAFGEHAEATHGMWVYNATQHVPFILSGAGVIPGVVKEPVSTADLTPSILRLVGQPIPPDLDGKPQPGSVTVPYSESYQLSERFKLAPQRAVVSGNLKLVANPRPELYDVIADPNELTNPWHAAISSAIAFTVGAMLPMLAILTLQIALIAALAYWVVFRVMGKDYESAVMSAGMIGFGLGATSNALATMRVLVARFGPAPRAFLIVPIVGAFLIDFLNALVTTAALNFFR